jgi:hypothetical protein
LWLLRLLGTGVACCDHQHGEKKTIHKVPDMSE